MAKTKIQKKIEVVATKEVTATQKKLVCKATLPSDVAEKYELVGWVGGNKQRFGSFGVVDLSRLTIEKARFLVKNGFSKLVETNPTFSDVDEDV